MQKSQILIFPFNGLKHLIKSLSASCWPRLALSCFVHLGGRRCQMKAAIHLSKNKATGAFSEGLCLGNGRRVRDQAWHRKDRSENGRAGRIRTACLGLFCGLERWSQERGEAQGQCKDILESQWEEAQAPCLLGWSEAGAVLCGLRLWC